ncbi:Uncharacterised protein [Mycobacteroides abscessus subsp. abscessus]|nr:Uncharacterised protein [Mycobacteroides abscessus subsp. abscessus]
MNPDLISSMSVPAPYPAPSIGMSMMSPGAMYAV